jgi:hypothetical protein
MVAPRFRSFDLLAGPRHAPEDVAATILELARATLGLARKSD